ncbi:MAG: phosphodiester glycosidase family protein [Pseudomonadota bacterium]
MMARASALFLASMLIACGASPADEPVCRALSFEDMPHIVCTVDRDADIRLRLRDADGMPLGQFDRLAADLGAPAVMLMNGGMYHADRAPVGLYVEDGQEVAPLVTRAGPGNFGLVPNGVFWSDGERVHVTETLAFEALEAEPDFATQSGPMLVIDGALHPRFDPDSESRKRRNGVGISGDRVVFAISDAPVTFHHFARLFRDSLGADNALFLDGSISRIVAPELGREERGGDLGPMIAVMADPAE